MQRVNSELIACKKKTSDFFLNMKRDERINKAERDCAWFQKEATNMSMQVDTLKKQLKKTELKRKMAEDEVRSWKQQAECHKGYNTILKKTIVNLKSMEHLNKYKEQGKYEAEKEILDLFSGWKPPSENKDNSEIARESMDLMSKLDEIRMAHANKTSSI